MHTQTRRLLLNIGLLLSVVGGGGYFWWQAHQPAPTTQVQLSTLDKAAITRIALVRHPKSATGETIRLVKQGDQWQMQEPKQAAVNPVRVTQLLTLLDEKVAARYDASGKDLHQYGLEPPENVLELNDETFVFGLDNPISHNRYVLHAGKINLLSESVYGVLTGSALDLIANTLVSPPRTVKQLTLPSQFAAKPETAQNWQMADALRVEAWDGTGASQGQITLSLDDGSTLTLDLLTAQGDLVIGNKALGIRYILPDTLRADLLPVAVPPTPSP